MVKVLFVTTISNTINSYLIPHIRLLHQLGCDVVIACSIVKPLNGELTNLGCKVYDIGFSRSIFAISNLSSIKKIRKIAKEEGCSLVHVHTPIAAFITRVACRNIPGLKVLYTAHGFHFFKGASFKSWIFYYPMERFAAKFTDELITINDDDYAIAKKMKLKTGGTIHKLYGIGVDIDRLALNMPWDKSLLRQKYCFKDEDFILFFAAELNYNKHQDLLINAVKKLKMKIPNIMLLLAGDGNMEEQYKQRVKDLELTDNIIFLGFREDIPDLLKITDVAVSSSRREGLPLNILEAMAIGLPVVATNCRGNRDLVVNGENGYIVGVNDIDSFSAAIEKLYFSPELRKNFGNNSRSLSDKYYLANVLDEMKKIYLNSLFGQNG